MVVLFHWQCFSARPFGPLPRHRIRCGSGGLVEVSLRRRDRVMFFAPISRFSQLSPWSCPTRRRPTLPVGVLAALVPTAPLLHPRSGSRSCSLVVRGLSPANVALTSHSAPSRRPWRYHFLLPVVFLGLRLGSLGLAFSAQPRFCPVCPLHHRSHRIPLPLPRGPGLLPPLPPKGHRAFVS
jgi:hypothetical protein